MSVRSRIRMAVRQSAWWVGTSLSAVATGQSLPDWDDYWFHPRGFDSAAGMNVSPETAMQLSAVFSCIRYRSETFATLPPILYRRLPNGGKERATDHPLYYILHDQPNQWQNSLEFYEMMQAHLDLRGNAYAVILPGPRGAVDQLVPQHPDLVRVFRLLNGRLRYEVTSRFTGEVKSYMQDEMLHIRGLSSDGLVGMSPIAVQRDAIGLGLGMQDYAARFIANDGKPPYVLQHPAKFKDDAARKKFSDSLQESSTGQNRGKVLVLEDGMTAKDLGITNKDSQFLEARAASREEICGFYRVPPHKIGILARSTNNNIEHQGIEAVTDCIRPICVRWERRINLDLIDPINDAIGAEPGEYFLEFLCDGLLRGDLKSRYDAYAIGRTWGWLSPNDVCNFENMNPIPPEKGGDDYLRQINTVVSGSAAALAPAPGGPAPLPPDQPAPDAPDDPAARASRHSEALVKSFAIEAARRVVRKEVTALRKLMQRAVSPDTFRVEAADFYRGHLQFTSETMCISPADASRYVNKNADLVFEAEGFDAKASALDWIEDAAPDALAAFALGGALEVTSQAVLKEGTIR